MPLDNQHNPVAPSSHAARARGCTCHMNIAALTSELAALRDAMRSALADLHALAWGECPSLLNEDSGGDGMLDVRISELVSVDTFRAERDRYRTALEQIAKYGPTLEQDLTQRALNGGDDE